MQTKANFSDGFPAGFVTWAKMTSYPQWPAVIVNRSAAVEAGDKLPPATSENRTVGFFNDSGRFAVVDCKFLVEYTAGMNNVRRAGAYLDDILAACSEASDYIRERGSKEQQDALGASDSELPSRARVEKGETTAIGDGSQKKKIGPVGKEPIAIARGGVTSKVAKMMGKNAEETGTVAGPSRNGHRRSRGRGESSNADGTMPLKKRTWVMSQMINLGRPADDEIEPVANVAMKAEEKDKYGDGRCERWQVESCCGFERRPGGLFAPSTASVKCVWMTLGSGKW